LFLVLFLNLSVFGRLSCLAVSFRANVNIFYHIVFYRSVPADLRCGGIFTDQSTTNYGRPAVLSAKTIYFISLVVACWNKIILKNFRSEPPPLVTMLTQFYFISDMVPC